MNCDQYEDVWSCSMFRKVLSMGSKWLFWNHCKHCCVCLNWIQNLNIYLELPQRSCSKVLRPFIILVRFNFRLIQFCTLYMYTVFYNHVFMCVQSCIYCNLPFLRVNKFVWFSFLWIKLRLNLMQFFLKQCKFSALLIKVCCAKSYLMFSICN